MPSAKSGLAYEHFFDEQKKFGKKNKLRALQCDLWQKSIIECDGINTHIHNTFGMYVCFWQTPYHGHTKELDVNVIAFREMWWNVTD